LRPKPRTFIARQARRLAERWTGRTFLPIDYPPREQGPRYGYGRPPHAPLAALLRDGEDAYTRNLSMIAGYADELAAIPAGPDPVVLAWKNAWLPPMDIAALYGFLRSRAPAQYVEIGSGMSTLCARLAIQDGALPTRLTSIDPQPRAEVDAACDRVIREPLEALDLSVFDDVSAGDVVFMDGSHRVLTNSDTVAFFLDVLPTLPDGVLVGVHDILLPDDYLPQWSDWHWSEQYLVGAYLLAQGSQVRLELATHYAHAHAGLDQLLEPLWSKPALDGLLHTGVALWLTTTGRGSAKSAAGSLA
jgi:predicted O-methyltransferase YrrM